MADRFVKIFEDEIFYISDTKNLKTLTDFENELREEYRDNGIGYNISTVQEIAKEEYCEYLYENSMTATEIADKLNKYYNELNLLKRHLRSAKDYLEGGHSKKAIELLKLIEVIE